MTTLYTTEDDEGRIIVLTMIAKLNGEYRFLYAGTSWKLQVHASGKKAVLDINNVVQDVDNHPVTRPAAKLVRKKDGVWVSFVSFKRKGKVSQRKTHSRTGEGFLDCAAKTLRSIYYG